MRFRQVAVFVWLAFLAVSSHAQQLSELDMLPSPTHLKSSIQFEHLTIEDGLSQSSVYDIMQDSRGFMWFATQDGLNRYDGHEFEVYKRQPFDTASYAVNFIWSIAEAPDGAIWTGMNNGGVSRLDPVTGKVQTYRANPEDSTTLSHDFVFDVHVDRDGIVWAGTPTGLNRLDPKSGAVTRYVSDPEDSTSLSFEWVADVFEDESGTLWVGTGNGLNRFYPETGTFERFFYDPEAEGGARIPPHMVVNIIEVPETNELWAATGSGLLRFDLNTDETEIFVHDDGEVAKMLDVVADPHIRGVLWVTTETSGLVRFDSRSGEFDEFRHDSRDPNSIGSDALFALHTDRSGIIWVGSQSGSGLDRFDPSTGGFQNYKHRPGDPTSLYSENVWGIYVAPSEPHVIWVTLQEDAAWTSDRLNRIDQRTGEVTQFVHDPSDSRSLGGGRVYAIHEDRSGRLWIGTRDGGLNLFDRRTETFQRLTPQNGNDRSLSDADIHAILEDSEGMLWLGTHRGGVNRMDPRQPGVFERFLHDPDDPETIAGNLISRYGMAEDRQGYVWVGGAGGLSRIDKRTGKVARYELSKDDSTGLQGNFIGTVYVDLLDRVWARTTGPGGEALNLLDRVKGTFTRFEHDPGNPNSLSDSRIISMHERASEPGVLWLGTPAGGLNRFDTRDGSFTHYLERDGLPNNMIYGILEDDDGRLWLSTNNGLSRFDTDTEGFRNFDEDDGLQSREFNSNAYFRSAAGQLIFGGINGVTAFSPRDLRPNQVPPSVLLTDFRLFNKSVIPGPASVLTRPLSETTEIRMSHYQKTLTFGFVGLHYLNPEKNQYAYKLDGFDDDWVAAGVRREATYTNLDPGRYTFRVRAANSDGVWTEQGASMALIIAPPFWDTWWFKILAVVAVLGMAVTFYQARVRHMRERNRLLESQVAERTTEIRSKNDQLEKSHAIVQAINRETGLESLLGSVLEQTRIIPGVEKATALVYDEMEDAFVVKASIGWSREQTAPIRITDEEAHERYVQHAEEVASDIFLERDLATRPGNETLQELEAPAALLVMRIPGSDRTDGYIVFDNMHNRDAFDQRDVDLLISLREHLQSAFGKTRLLDNLQRSIQNLRSTQAQLVQSEKMASLGQLTAGIAHEIKNPLNFINNFAALSAELADELEVTLAHHREKLGPDAEEIEAILSDLRLNADKINEHGRRADGIVKSMLQHSRGKGGEREAVDINALLDEYVSLAYHGMRAQKIDFNVTLERRFGEDIGLVPIIPQEMGRVFINLLNNAFYAVHDKRQHTNGQFAPTVEVATARRDDRIEIRIVDNGPGIPEHVRQRIFEPFYTTKPTGEGTGLGLSMSYEIITQAHGGALDVSSADGEGTTFTITLPAEPTA